METQIIWSDQQNNQIKSTDLTGCEVEVLAQLNGQPYGLVLDPVNEKLYCVNQSEEKIQCIDLVNGDVSDIVAVQNNPEGIAIDLANGKIYWTNNHLHQIECSKLDGSEKTVLITGLDTPRAIFVSSCENKLYWSEKGIDKIRKANLDGTSIEDVVTGVNDVSGMYLDIVKRELYWSDRTLKQIMKINLDNATITTVIVLPDPSSPRGLTIDHAANKVYWADDYHYTISCADLDVLQPTEIVGSDMAGQPFGVVLVKGCTTTPEEDWHRAYESPTADRVMSVLATEDGGSIMAGFTSVSGGEDILIKKLHANGELEWSKTLPESGRQFGYDIQKDLTDGYIIAGSTNLNHANHQPYLVKIDAAGDVIWTEVYEMSGESECQAVVVCSDGTFAVTGYYSWGNLFILKTDAVGGSLWLKKHDDFDLGSSIAQTSTGGFVVTGYTSKNSNGVNDIFILTTDSEGNKLADNLYGESRSDFGYSVKQTTDGGFVAAGYTQTSAGHNDIYLIKTEPDLTASVGWPIIIENPYDDFAKDVFVTDSDEYVFTGKIGSPSDTDVFLKKYNKAGKCLWSCTFDTTVIVQGFSVDQTLDGGYVIAARRITPEYDHDFMAIHYRENRPPYVDIQPIMPVGEGGIGTLCANGYDPDGDPLIYKWDLDFDGNFETPGQCVLFDASASDGPFDQPVQVMVESCGLAAYDTGVVPIYNIAPEILSITAPVDPVHVDALVSVSAEFMDSCLTDEHTAYWFWGDGESTEGIIDKSVLPWSITSTHRYDSAGVYTLRLYLADDDGGDTTATHEFIVVFDPTAGFVTGGGWINSPEGAFPEDPTLTGKANFGFVSKYKKGQSTPDGNTKFVFKVADLNFKSTSYDWLVIAGPNAKYKGSGAINGEGDYGFMLTAVDGTITGGGDEDNFRIKIWEKEDETVVYDNQADAADDANATDGIEGGSIVIHKAALKKALRGDEEETVQIELPEVYNLAQNYPNPFNPSTEIHYSLPESAEVHLEVFSVTGTHVTTLIQAHQEAGAYKLTWYGKDGSGNAVSAGLYLCHMKAGSFQKTIRMMLLK